ncbi:TIGR03032 family protein [Gloeocapsa sp. PCC 73106]|uniref:TIGR03032 family protein n=1 Tax=Gloeocapsa sp. PCC 73106 TaxID=102232 RepID=UPI0002AC8E3A|nr:TIGR03032 family protein [Gloeocapsa sp. PCC 73106]ELR97308.1 TIGR03032 family protein [Gloeocapsa sp. PCC 73106]
MDTPSPQIEMNTSRQFVSWLAEQNLSFAFTTYQAGKIFFIGLQPTGQLSVFERTLDRCMGLYATNNSLYISTLYQIWRWENTLQLGETYQDYDALYVPQMSYVTGDLDVHDITYTQSEGIIFVNTLFSCLSTVSPSHSFIPWWQPPFISRLGAEDKCHLNGLALRDGKPRYVTAVSESDIVSGWREKRQTGGCVIDIQSNQIIARGLSMPHSPRWHQEKLWLLNSGTGEFGYIDLDTGKFNAIAFCPGYLRGLAFKGDFALVGLSKSRENKTFSGLLLDEKLKQAETEARCGIFVIDLKRGDIVHFLSVDGVVKELYDVVIFEGIQRPMAIGFLTDEIRRVITIGEPTHPEIS